MDEDFKDVTTSSHHIAIIFFLLIILLVIAGYFFVFKPTHFSLRSVSLELGEQMSEDVKDYLNKFGGSIVDYKINLSGVDPDAVGEYTYTVTNGKITKKGKIEVVDTRPPEFTTRELVIEEGSTEYFLGDFLATCEDNSKPCLVSLKNKSDDSKFSKVGEYDIDIEVADVYGNKKEAKAHLKVVEEGTYTDPRTLDLEYVTSSKKGSTFDGIIYKTLEQAIDPQSDKAREVISNISTVDLANYVQENYPGYRIVASEIIELYNKSNFITGFAIELDITNGNEKTIYVDPTKVMEKAPTSAEDDEQQKEE